ncbi:hypothetical protein JGI24_01369 [Candidatus Kryptobacter tengchongensis]|uniref:Uncharacterized protein n=1 Tax=Kryptobacter tengchongensis TaxID=1643429 RepID=A0A656D9A8_KRYT1|nr:hypothetical protein JGI24_01369 [Candidatus Kryptobacter tengchongensis]
MQIYEKSISFTIKTYFFPAEYRTTSTFSSVISAPQPAFSISFSISGIKEIIFSSLSTTSIKIGKSADKSSKLNLCILLPAQKPSIPLITVAPASPSSLTFLTITSNNGFPSYLSSSPLKILFLIPLISLPISILAFYLNSLFAVVLSVLLWGIVMGFQETVRPVNKRKR